MTTARVTITDEAVAMVALLVERHGPLLFHQSGGCCDGSSPMCFPRFEFKVGAQDIYLGDIAGQPFYIRSRLFTDDESAALAAAGPPPNGEQHPPG